MFSVIDEVKFRPAVKGFLTLIPGTERLLPASGTGGTDSASYCYGVWLKHLTLLWANEMCTMPDTLGELGPGDSLGIGLAAMLSGVNHYFALDVVQHSNIGTNLKIFDELVALFKSRASRPAKGWPDFDNHLNSRLFPDHILTEERLADGLARPRIAAIRRALENPGSNRDEISIKYMVPWEDPETIAPNSVDLLLSHSVLEHVVNLEHTYRSLYLWLHPDGIMSHQIDFTSHGLSKSWNGYRVIPEALWQIMVGKRAYLINREPRSTHLQLLRKSGFDIVCDMHLQRTDGVRQLDVSKRWASISEDDLTCSGAYLQARKHTESHSTHVAQSP